MDEWIGTGDSDQEWTSMAHVQWIGEGVVVVITKSYVGSSVSDYVFESKNPDTNYYFESN